MLKLVVVVIIFLVVAVVLLFILLVISFHHTELHWVIFKWADFTLIPHEDDDLFLWNDYFYECTPYNA